MMNSKAIILFFCLVSTSIWGQFEGHLSASKISAGETVTAYWTLHGTGKNFKEPNFGGLEVISGPSQNQSYQNINGRTSASITISYNLYAEKPGVYEIGPASIISNGRRLKSSPLKLTVIKSKKANNNAQKGEKVYVKLIPSDTNAVVGQQITIDYKLFTQIDVNGYSFAKEDNYPGFYAQELFNYRSEVQKETVDGEVFWTKTIKRIALFPQRTGKYEISPARINLKIPIPGSRPRGFFGMVQTRTRVVNSNGITLNVQSPPDGAPISFSGGIGKFGMRTSINKTKVTTDDVVVITMEIQGTGDGKTFSPPVQPENDAFDIYDPKVIQDEDSSKDGIIYNYKKIEYIYVPLKPGRYTIKPEFSYFDPEKNKYITLVDKEYQIEVKQGSRKIMNKDRDVQISGKIMPNRNHQRAIPFFLLKYHDSYLWALLGIILLGAMWIGYKKYKLYREDNISIEEKRRRKISRLINEKLKKAKTFKDEGKAKDFYSELSTAMNAYLGQKFDLEFSNFDKKHIIETLKNNNVDPKHIDEYLEIMDKCKKAIYAGEGGGNLENWYQKASNLINKLERKTQK